MSKEWAIWDSKVFYLEELRRVIGPKLKQLAVTLHAHDFFSLHG